MLLNNHSVTNGADVGTRLDHWTKPAPRCYGLVSIQLQTCWPPTKLVVKDSVVLADECFNASTKVFDFSVVCG